MRRITSSRMSVDIRGQHQHQHHPPPRTPRKVRINPPSPEANRSTPRKIAQSNGHNTSTGSPESTRTSGFGNGGPDLASAKEASRRMNLVADNFISPRKLPDDRFNSIVRSLNHASNIKNSNGTRSTDEQSIAGTSDSSKLSHRKPRKLSVNSHSAKLPTGVGVNGHK